MPEASPSPPPITATLLVPSVRFFTRRIALLATADVESQVQLALEGLSPFPVDQLHHGFLLSAARDEALVYAAYRKHFSREENTTWVSAAGVLPDFAVLLGEAPATPAIRCWRRGEQVTAIGWNGAGALPAVISSRADIAESEVETLVAKLQNRLGLGELPVEKFNGDAEITRDARTGDLSLAVPGQRTTLSREMLGTMDVREKTFLQARREAERRERVLWHIFQAALAGIALLLVIEATLLAGNFWTARIESAVALAAPKVAKIEAAKTLSARVEELARRRLQPFEMLSLLNRDRPESILFLRATTPDRLTLEIEAQTSAANEINQYENALHKSPVVEKIDIRDLRSRDGITSFVLSVTFRAPALQPPHRP